MHEWVNLLQYRKTLLGATGKNKKNKRKEKRYINAVHSTVLVHIHLYVLTCTPMLLPAQLCPATSLPRCVTQRASSWFEEGGRKEDEGEGVLMSERGWESERIRD